MAVTKEMLKQKLQMTKDPLNSQPTFMRMHIRGVSPRNSMETAVTMRHNKFILCIHLQAMEQIEI